VTEVVDEGAVADAETAVEAKARQGRDLDRRFELIEAVILAIATVLTAWSAFQSTKWGGDQADAFNTASAARVESAKASTLAGQQTNVDVAVFLQWLSAIDSERKADPNASIGADGTYEPSPSELSGFLAQRFRAEFTPAFDAWIAQRPLTNPDAAKTPFELPEYKLAASAKAADLEAQAAQSVAEAKRDDDRSDSYVLLTVLFASVLFFAGISSKMDTLRARLLLLGMAVLVLVASSAVLVTLPRSI
jgi:hypothetical protein